jgi:hypothetical protein
VRIYIDSLFSNALCSLCGEPDSGTHWCSDLRLLFDVSHAAQRFCFHCGSVKHWTSPCPFREEATAIVAKLSNICFTCLVPLSECPHPAGSDDRATSRDAVRRILVCIGRNTCLQADLDSYLESHSWYARSAHRLPEVTAPRSDGALLKFWAWCFTPMVCDLRVAQVSRLPRSFVNLRRLFWCCATYVSRSELVARLRRFAPSSRFNLPCAPKTSVFLADTFRSHATPSPLAPFAERRVVRNQSVQHAPSEVGVSSAATEVTFR